MKMEGRGHSTSEREREREEWLSKGVLMETGKAKSGEWEL